MEKVGSNSPAPSQAGGLRTDLVALAAGDRDLRARAASALEDGGLSVAAAAATTQDWEPAHLEGVGVAVVCADIAAPAQAYQLRLLKAQLEPMRIVMVAPSPGPIGLRRLLDAGVEGLVLEEDLEQALAATVRAVLAGQIVIPSSARRQMEQPALTSREKQVLGMVTLGFANGEIAGKLYLAESTIKSHLSSAFAKLGVKSRSEATALILDPNGALGPGILKISDGPPAEAPDWTVAK